ncbi:hypothetical protein RRV45_03820 [Bacillus sp. DTU_2020_1000418_1_SI_GHA_SEK_038]|uniref:hypothetical protein n=1 Tax=Bacillus sp. DTU_2020_1000418_1_SI_GHA_SEK_038 TaxID=3077585 RepID=UPI0028EF7901|nr:hypothetical protein [Bacillus sp. DTU_2020_1000418_1_SI_GHA_SEK_038]WNS76152.1 hypothetical protein RRV45_03820 [Bacillus sp. DTU_2020_1000418_1_SI_GHA_SEK_038]
MFVIECFDECLLEICFIQNGKIITKHKTDEEEEFDKDEINEALLSEDPNHQLDDVGAIIKLLDLDVNEKELTEILKIEDIEDKISSLEKLFKIDIWVKADWVEDDDDLRLKFKLFSMKE